VALIAVLWLLALLTLLASAVAALSVTHRQVFERYAESVQAESIDDSAIRVVLLRLFAGRRSGTAWLIAQPQAHALLDSSVDVMVTRELGRVDLNAAAPEILMAFFAANGWTESDAQAMADRIVLCRQTDASRVPDAPFHAVTELKQLPGGAGITPELLDAFTVYSQAPVPLPTAAPGAVRKALLWADRHQSGGHRWLTDEPQIGAESLAAEPAALIGEVLRVQACLRGSAAVQCRVATVRLTGNINKPLQVFEWKTDVGTKAPANEMTF